MRFLALKQPCLVLRNLVENTLAQQCSRFASTITNPNLSSPNTILTSVDSSNGIAILSLNRPPVNSFSLELLQEIKAKIIDLESDKDIRGIVFSSESKAVFSAVLDLQELHQFDQEVRKFLGAFQDLWYHIYSCKLPTAAAINGHAIAGGCVIANCSDYRVMVRGKFSIGLNESQFGLVAPFYLIDSYAGCIGKRMAEKALMLGTLFSPEEAKSISLVDELVDNKEDAIRRCKDHLIKLGKAVPQAVILSKLRVRKSAIERFEKGRDSDLDEFVRLISTPDVQKRVKQYIESLKKK